MDWIAEAGSWEKVVKKDITRLLEHYKGQGVEKVGTFGFCWGSKMAVEVVAEMPGDVKAAVLIHPSFVSTDDGDRVKAPTLALPTKDDNDMVYWKLVAYS